MPTCFLQLPKSLHPQALCTCLALSAQLLNSWFLLALQVTTQRPPSSRVFPDVSISSGPSSSSHSSQEFSFGARTLCVRYSSPLPTPSLGGSARAGTSCLRSFTEHLSALHRALLMARGGMHGLPGPLELPPDSPDSPPMSSRCPQPIRSERGKGKEANTQHVPPRYHVQKASNVPFTFTPTLQVWTIAD